MYAQNAIFSLGFFLNLSYLFNHAVKGAICSFEKQTKTLNFNTHRINSVTQTQKYTFYFSLADLRK